MHKTGFHWQYFDKSRFITQKIQNRAYNKQKRRHFSCFYPKTSIKANICTLKAISRTDIFRLSKKLINIYHGIRFNLYKFVKFVKKIRCSIICLYNFDQNNAKFSPFLVNMLCFISNFPTFCRFWHVTNADCQHKETKHKHIIFVYNIDQNFTYVCKILVNLLYFCISHLCYLISNLFSESVLCFIRQRAHKILDRLRLLPQEETWLNLLFERACKQQRVLNFRDYIQLW